MKKERKKKPKKKAARPRRAPAAINRSVPEMILAAVRRIPRGKVCTYGNVAEVAGLPRRARLLSRSATLAARKSGGAMSEALLEHYRATLAKIRETGFLVYGTRQLSPYVSAALKGFSPGQPTHTESFVRHASAAHEKDLAAPTEELKGPDQRS